MMIAKIKWTQNNAQQNIEQFQNHTMGATINNEPTITEPPPYNGQQPKSLGRGAGGGLKCILLVPNLRQVTLLAKMIICLCQIT